MARWRAGLLAWLLLLAGPAWAQVVPGGPSVGGPATEAIPVRCANTTATAFVDCGGGSGTTTVSDGAGAGISDVVNATPTTEYGLVVRFPSLPTGTNVIGGVTGSGNFTVVQPTGTNLHIVCDSGCGGAASFADEATFTIGTTAISIMGALVDEVTPDSAPEGSAAAPRMAPNRVLYSILRDAAGNERGANVTAGNALVVDGSAATQPVSGTITANAGTGTFTVSGTVTANAGTNLNTSALALEASLVKLPLAQGSTTSGQSGPLTQGAVTTAAPTYTTAQTSPLSLTTAGGLRVDGSGVTQPVSGTVTANAGTGNFSTVGTASDNSANSTAKLPVIAARANAAAPAWTEGNQVPLSVDLAGAQRVTGIVAIFGSTWAAVDGATGDAPPVNVVYVGGKTSGATGGLLTGITVCDSFVNVSVATATTTLLVTGVAGRHVHLCGISLLTAGANNVALISGTGATCGTGTTGMTGGTTAATGYNFAANGGIAQGSGVGAINRTNATGDSVCIVTSAAVQLSGRISYAIY